MAKTKIEWADYTFNPWRGCTKIAPGCEHCYAERDSKRNSKIFGVWGERGTRVVAAESYWRNAFAWNVEALAEEAVFRFFDDNPIATDNVARGLGFSFEAAQQAIDGLVARGCLAPIWDEGNLGGYVAVSHYRKPTVFCASIADVFEDWKEPAVNSRGETMFVCRRCRRWYSEGEARCPRPHNGFESVEDSPLYLDDIRRRLWVTIDATDCLDWLLLTKRPENIPSVIPIDFDLSKGRPKARRNLWLGCSVSDQATADRALPELAKCRDLASVLWVSYEPALGPVDFGPWLDVLDWVVAGGESGPAARPSRPDWFRSVFEQCADAGVAFFFKQWGEWKPSIGYRPGTPGRFAIVGDDSHVEVASYPRSYDLFGASVVERAGKRYAGRSLDGVEHSEYPRRFFCSNA